MIPLALAMSDAPPPPEDAEGDAGSASPFRPPALGPVHDPGYGSAPAPEPASPTPDGHLDRDPDADDAPALDSPPDLNDEVRLDPEPERLDIAYGLDADPDDDEELDAPEPAEPVPFEPEPVLVDEGIRAAPSSPSAPAPPRRPPWQRAALAILLIAAAGMIGYVLSTSNERPNEPDALTRSIEAAGNLRLLFRTDMPAEAQQFIREEFGWRVGVPLFSEVSLTGVAIAQAAAAVEVPVFLYADEDDQNVAVFAYSYALLDQVPDRLRLSDDDYDGLAEGVTAVRETYLGDVLLWRDRDDIYVAVTDLPPADLVGGLTMTR